MAGSQDAPNCWTISAAKCSALTGWTLVGAPRSIDSTFCDAAFIYWFLGFVTVSIFIFELGSSDLWLARECQARVPVKSPDTTCLEAQGLSRRPLNAPMQAP